MSLPESIEIYTDGASRGNPGPGSYAYVIVADDEILQDDAGYLGTTTNNKAEYEAIIHALDYMADHEGQEATLYSDSKLVINQVHGKWQVKDNALEQRHERVQQLLTDIDVAFSHVPRNTRYVERADALCNKVLDERI